MGQSCALCCEEVSAGEALRCAPHLSDCPILRIASDLQFQITITVTSVLLAFVSGISNPEEQSVLTPVQLMWINLFQDTLAALALATDPPQQRVLDRKPEPRTSPLITLDMWKTIIGQSVYQSAATLVLYFAGPRIFPYQTETDVQQVNTLVFNAYVWMQIFNMYKYVYFSAIRVGRFGCCHLTLLSVADSTIIPSIFSRGYCTTGCF